MRRAVLVALALGAAQPARAADPNRASVDLYYFGQRDPGSGAVGTEGVPVRGGNPLRAEGFDYGAASIDFRVALTDDVAFIGNAGAGWIQDEGVHPIPSTVRDAEVLSASPSLLILDSSAAVEIQAGDWTITPGLFYHHQKSYFVGGPNLDVRRALAGGDASLFANLQFRINYNGQRGWYGFGRDADYQTTTSVLVGWTQVWAPGWLTTVSGRYVGQTGLLHSNFNYIALYDLDGRVTSLFDENLPRVRHRGQVNLRARYSWSPGWSVGLDTSGYLDTWSIVHGSVEPSFELPLGTQARLRFWYRLSVQRGTRFLIPRPVELVGFYTQDSDLGTFQSHSPGALVSFPVGDLGGLAWEARLAIFGFYRSDEVFAGGGQGGMVTTW